MILLTTSVDLRWARKSPLPLGYVLGQELK